MAPSPDALRLERGGADARRRQGQDSFDLPALGPSVAEARRRVRTRLQEWGVGCSAWDDAEMVVSELFTNAVRHSGSERVGCALRADGGVLRLEVADQGRGATEPKVRAAGVDEECGRGLLLVGALSRAWGVRPGDSGEGRVVWAELVCGR